MANTPEGKVKALIKQLLKTANAYYEMPVPGGYGVSGLDFVVCYNGFFLAIEAKAPGKKPTARQLRTINSIREAGGVALVVDGKESLKAVAQWLHMMQHKHPMQLFNTPEATVQARIIVPKSSTH